MSTRTLYASLIGINNYQAVSKLNGCVKDILNFDKILRNVCKVQKTGLSYQPLYFLAPQEWDTSVEDYAKEIKQEISITEPTFENISGKAFEHLGQAKGEDICVLYYSGHGSTMDAPPEFLRQKGNPQNETIVCVDSRTSKARDLIDKEMAFLLHKALKDKPKVHCLVIMDCCHSADNMRGMVSTTLEYKNRQATPSPFPPCQLKDYMGYKEGFFKIEKGKASYELARYVQLSACRDNEQSRDTPAGGLFSIKLKELLLRSGTTLTYRNIEKSLMATVALVNEHQNPVAEATVSTDKDQPFLGGGVEAYHACFEVRYNFGQNRWELMAGLLEGITASNGGIKSEVMIVDTNVKAEITEVENTTSVLEGSKLESLDKKSNFYKAQIASLAIRKKRLGVSAGIKAIPALWNPLVQAAQKGFIYIELLKTEVENVDYLIDFYKKDDTTCFYLTNRQDGLPLFKGETSASTFLNNAEAMAKWHYVKSLMNPVTSFTSDDFIFTVERIEGVKITEKNINSITGEGFSVSPGSQTVFSYRKNTDDTGAAGYCQPAVRFNVQINPKSSLSQCYVRFIYLDSQFGMNTKMGSVETNLLLKKEGAVYELKYKNEKSGREYNLIGLSIDNNYAKYGINEIIDRLKVVVSSQPVINLDHYDQESLSLDNLSAWPERSKSIIQQSKGGGSPIAEEPQKNDWAVFDFDLRIIGSDKMKQLRAGSTTSFDNFSITVPDNFEAHVITVSASDIASSKSGSGRFNIGPGAGIWGPVLTEDSVFETGVKNSNSDPIVALELTPVDRKLIPRVGPEKPIKLTLNQLAVTPADPAMESTIIPYGFDQETGLYYPIGYMINHNEVVIEQLPNLTPGSLVSTDITTKSITSSIKLYFKKLFKVRSEDIRLHYFKNGGWHSTNDTTGIRQLIDKLPVPKPLPLVIHGIFGDTQSIIESLKTDTRVATDIGVLLSYDYENLESHIAQIADKLKKDLDEIGISHQSGRKLTVIAHSMGGLVTRQFLSKYGDEAIISKFIMAGPPNGGSEWGKASGQIVGGAGLLLTHALNVTGPLKWAITGIGFLMKNFYNPGNTLQDMSIDSSFLKHLKDKPLPTDISYFVIGSDTSLVEGANTQDPFLKKLPQLLKKDLLYPGLNKALFGGKKNDMAVTLSSMQAIKGLDNDQNMEVFPGDHLSYFSEKITRDKIVELII